VPPQIASYRRDARSWRADEMFGEFGGSLVRLVGCGWLDPVVPAVPGLGNGPRLQKIEELLSE
jgi:hypothetical protein